MSLNALASMSPISVYTDADGRTVVEDVKGFRTKEYLIRRKLMLFRYGIRIQEVEA